MAGKLLVVVGSGPGVGVTTATQFVSQGFDKIALLSRNPERIKSDVAAVQKASSSATVKAFPADVGDHEALTKALRQVEAELGAPEAVLFNAARIAEVTLFEEPAENIINDFKVANIGLYTAATWAAPHLEAKAKDPSSRPSFFLSGGYVYNNPKNQLFSLSMQKAAQHNLLTSFSQFLGPKGVHVANVNICGVVKDEDPVINAKNIAEQFWTLYNQDKSDWAFQINVGNPFPPE